jgi:predicted homoserine dehydrogenase-like protein
VDYVLGAEPSPGVFVLGYNDHPIKQQYLQYLKMGDGPFYVFYRPYHLCHLEVPLTVARAVLFQDATIAPLGAPVCDVITAAKKDLKAGELLDGIGGFNTYGTIDNTEFVVSEKCLPMGLSEGCRLKRDISRDQVITYDDVEIPPGRLSDDLRAEQDEFFPAYPAKVIARTNSSLDTDKGARASGHA